jgi:hypothetical protein
MVRATVSWLRVLAHGTAWASGECGGAGQGATADALAHALFAYPADGGAGFAEDAHRLVGDAGADSQEEGCRWSPTEYGWCRRRPRR